VRQADDLPDSERDGTHDDNISVVFFSGDGVGEPCFGGRCVSKIQGTYTFHPVCGI